MVTVSLLHQAAFRNVCVSVCTCMYMQGTPWGKEEKKWVTRVLGRRTWGPWAGNDSYSRHLAEVSPVCTVQLDFSRQGLCQRLFQLCAWRS